MPFAGVLYPRQYRLRVGVRPGFDSLTIRLYLHPYRFYLVSNAYAADKIYVISAYLSWVAALIQVFYDAVLVTPLDYSGVFVCI